MEKYGVSVTDPQGKVASEDGTCSECGQPTVVESNVPKCPVHGTEPFEEKDSKDAP